MLQSESAKRGIKVLAGGRLSQQKSQSLFTRQKHRRDKTPSNAGRLMTMLTGVVLAGGLSTRMGTDKSQLVRKQQTMLEFTASQLLRAGVDDVVISGPASLPNTAYPIYPDQRPQLGPMGGISSIANQLSGKTDHLLIIPVDLPLLDHHQLIKLKQKGLATDRVTVFQGQPLPLFLPLKASFLQCINHQVEQADNLSIRHFLDKAHGDKLESDNQSSWFNSNTPEEWQEALSLIEQKAHP